MKKSCVIYATWADQILNLPPDVAGEYIQAILKYAIYGEDTEPENPFIKAMLVPVKKKLDEDAEAYAEVIKQRSEGGKKGMARRWHKEDITQDKSVITPDKSVIKSITPITVTVTDTVTDTVKKNKKKGFHDFQERKIDYSKIRSEGQ